MWVPSTAKGYFLAQIFKHLLHSNLNELSIIKPTAPNVLITLTGILHLKSHTPPVEDFPQKITQRVCDFQMELPIYLKISLPL